MTEEELDAELERLDQNITFALLETDQNFAKANQIVAEKIIPEVDRFTQASSQVRKGNEVCHVYDASLVQVIDSRLALEPFLPNVARSTPCARTTIVC